MIVISIRPRPQRVLWPVYKREHMIVSWSWLSMVCILFFQSIQHELVREVDSAIPSFLAVHSEVICTDDNGFKAVGTGAEPHVSVLLSKLIYCVQLITLQNVLRIRDHEKLLPAGQLLQPWCAPWDPNNICRTIRVLH